jgi:hypothetical protein
MIFCIHTTATEYFALILNAASLHKGNVPKSLATGADDRAHMLLTGAQAVGGNSMPA